MVPVLLGAGSESSLVRASSSFKRKSMSDPVTCIGTLGLELPVL